jgi:hypothetical protein
LLDQRQVIAHIPPEVSILADSGFQGLKHPGICLPWKGTKKRPLETSQKEWNTLLAGLRVVVEHGIGGMKPYNAASGVYRNRLPQADDKFNLLSACLWNFYIN